MIGKLRITLYSLLVLLSVNSYAQTIASIETSPAGGVTTNSSSVSFTVTFDQATTGIATSNFSLDASGVTATIGTPTTSDNITWDVPLTLVTYIGAPGTLSIDFATDTESPTITNSPFTGGEVYTIDQTSPGITGSSVTNTAGTELNLTFNPDETGTIYYVATLESTTPSEAQVLAGQDNSGDGSGTGDNLVGANAAVGATGSQVFDITGLTLTDAVTYYVHFLVQDDYGNNSTIVSVNVTADVNAPGITGSSLANTAGSELNLTFNPDETGTLYYVATEESTTPSEAQVLAGQDNSGDGSGTGDNLVGASAAVGSTGSQVFDITGLTLADATTYYVHFLVQDGSANNSTIVSVNIAADVDAPGITGSSLANTAGSELNLTFNPDETGTLYYVATEESTTPSEAQVLAGQDNSGDGSGTGDNLVGASAAVGSTGSQVFDITGLTLADATTYYVHFLVQDGSGNNSTIVSVNIAADVDAPGITGSSLVNTAGTELNLTFNPDETGTLYYVATEESTTPSEAQVLAGQDNSGDGSGTGDNLVGASAAVGSTGSQVFDITGLTLADATTYYVHFLVQDGSGNNSTIVSVNVTADVNAPGITGSSLGHTGATELNLTFNPDETGTIYYVATEESTTPSEAQVLAGQDNSGDGSGTGDNLVGASAAVGSTGSQVFDITGLTLTDATTYYVHFLVQDGSGNNSSIVSVNVLVDAGAPGITGSSLTNTAGTELNLTFNPDETGTLYYVATEEATTPSEAQVLAGQDNSGDGSGTGDNLVGASAAVGSTGSQVFDIIGLTLTNSTTYYVHFLVQDGSANNSTIVTVSVTADVNPPGITGSSLTNTAGTELNLTFNPDETGTLYYVATEESTTPSEAQVLAGQDNSGDGSGTGDNLVGANAAVGSTGSQVFDITGLTLTNSTTYYVHFLVQDGSGNNSTIVSVNVTADVNAPGITGSSLANSGTTELNLTFNPDETGTLYYVATEESTTPSEAQVLAGQDNSGDGSGTGDNLVGATSVVGSTGSQVFDITGLTLADATTYYVHFLVQDGSGNNSTIVSVNVTADAGAPGITGSSLTNTAGTELNLTFNPDETGTLYYVATEEATTPSEAQVLAGQDNSGDGSGTGDNLVGANAVVGSTGSQVFDITGLTLTDATTYYVHFLLQDGSANNSTIVTVSVTADVNPPGITGSSLTNTVGTELNLTFNPDEIGTLYYVATEEATTPSEAQVLAGQDNSGDGSGTGDNLVGATSVVGSTGSQVFDITGLTLTDATTYYVHFLVQDGSGNNSTIVSVNVTADVAAPIILSATTDDNDGNGQIDRIDIELSESIVDGSSTFTGSVVINSGFGGSINSITTGDSGNDQFIRVILNESGGFDTDALPDIDLVNGLIFDASGNTLGSDQNFGAVDDGASAVIVEAITLDEDDDGIVDAIELEFSEAMDDSDIDGIGTVIDDWSISSNSFGGGETDAMDAFSTETDFVSGGNDTDADDEFIKLTVSPTNVVGTAVYQFSYTNGGGNIRDANGAVLDDISATTATDGAAPAFLIGIGDATPFDEETGVLPGTILNEVTFTLSESVSIQNGGSFITLSDGSTEAIEANSSNVVISGGTDVTLTYSQIFQKGSSYRVNFDAGAFEDAAGNTSEANNDWNWTMQGIGTTPNIIATVPADLATNVAVSTDILLIFDEPVAYQNNESAPMDFNIFSAADPNFDLAGSGRDYTIDDSSTDPGFSPAYINDNTNIQDTITFSLSTASTNGSFTTYQGANTTYTVTIEAYSFEEKTNFNDAPSYSFSFTTAADGTPPSIEFTTPTNGSTVAATTTDLTVEFSEDVQAGTGNIELYADTNPDVLVAQFSISDPEVTFSAQDFTTDLITIDISSVNLSGGINYYVNIDNGAIEDAANNGFSGISDETTWNFDISAESTDPGLVSRSPADNSSNVDITTNMVLTFDEPVFAGSGGDIVLRYSGTNNIAQLITVPDASATFSGNQLTIDFPNDLSGQTSYYLTIEDNVIADNNGNTYNGFSSTSFWNFYTESGTDATGPSVNDTDPTDGTTDVSVLPTISITFDEPVFEGTGNFYVYDNDNGDAVVATFDVLSDVTVSGNIVSFTISSLLDFNNGYSFGWDAGVLEDAEGNGVAVVNADTYNFTTLDDTTDPTVLVFSPDDDETGVTPGNPTLTLKFSEPVVKGSGNITINYSNGVNVGTVDVADAAVTYTAADSTFAIDLSSTTPNVTLDGLTEYYLGIDGTTFEDSNGNTYAGVAANGLWSFITAADAVDPTITNQGSLDGTTGVDLSASFTLNMSERVYSGSGNIVFTSASQTITIPASDGSQVSGYGTRTLVVNPTLQFFNNTSYTVTFDADAVEDASGNDVSDTWSFTTGNSVLVAEPVEVMCTDADFVSIGDINIVETSNDDFGVGAGQTLIIELPTDFVFNTSAPAFVAFSGNDVSTASLSMASDFITVTYTVTGTSGATDVLSIRDLEVKYIGSSAVSNQYAVRSGGTGVLEGNATYHDQIHIDLSSSISPSSVPVIDQSAPAAASDINTLAVQNAATFTLDISSPVGGSTYNWYNLETTNSLTSTSVTQASLPDFDNGDDYLYSYSVTEQDASGCESDPAYMDIFVYQFSLNPVATSFEDTDDTGTEISISKPNGHTAQFSGEGLGSVSIPPVGTDGTATADFIPSAAGALNSPHTITYTVTNSTTGRSFDFTDGMTFTINSGTAMFDKGAAELTEFCLNDATYSDYDLETNIAASQGRFFYRIALYNSSNVEQTSAIIAPAGWQYSGQGGSALNPVSSHFLTDDWSIDPSALSAGTYILRYMAVPSGTTTPAIDEGELLSVDITIKPLPTIDFTNIDETYPYFCEDDTPFNLEISINGLDPLTGGDIAGYEAEIVSSQNPSGLVVPRAYIAGSTFDPSDPVGDGTNYVDSREYIYMYLWYTNTAAQDSVNGCINDSYVVNFTNNTDRLWIFTKPDAPLVNDGYTVSADETFYEYCEEETVNEVEASTSGTFSTSALDYYWVDNSSTDTLVEGSSTAVGQALLGSIDPAPGLYEIDLTLNIWSNLNDFDGCSSFPRRLDFEVYRTPDIPEVDLTGSTYGTSVSSDEYVYNLCEGDSFEDIMLDVTTLFDPSADSTFIWLDDTKSNINGSISASINQTALASELGLPVSAGTSDFETTFYVVQGEHRNTTTGFTGCPSDTVTITIRSFQQPEAPDVSTFDTDFYMCEGQNFIDAFGQTFIETPDSSGMEYTWYEDNAGVPGTLITTSFNERITQSELTAAGFDQNTPATYTYWVTQTRESNPTESFNGCESDATQVTITVFAFESQPFVDGTIDDGNPDAADVTYYYCADDLTSADVFNATTNYAGANDVEYNWYRSSSAGTKGQQISIDDQGGANADFSQATAFDLNLTGFDTDEEIYFLVTQTTDIISGVYEGCESPGTLIKFNIFADPGAPTSAQNTYYYCEGETINSIAVSSSEASKEFFWYNDVDLVGSVSDRLTTASADGSTITPAELIYDTGTGDNLQDDAVEGDYVFYVTQAADIDGSVSFDGCEGAARTITVSIRNVPSAPTLETSSLDFCLGDAIGTTINISNPDADAEYNWYDEGANYLNNTSFLLSYGNSSGQIPASTTGVFEFKVTQTTDSDIAGFAGCESDSTTLTVTINDTPAVPDADGNVSSNRYEYCEGDDLSSFTLDVTNPDPSATYKWYDDAGLTTLIATDTTVNLLSVQSLVTGGDVYLTRTDGICESDAQEVEIIENALPNVEIADLNDEYCVDASSITIRGRVNGANSSGGIFSINTGGLTDNGNGTATLDPAAAQTAAGGTTEGSSTTHTITYSFTDTDGCAASTDSTFTINPLPTVEIELSDGSNVASSYCEDEGAIDLRAVAEDIPVTTNVTFSGPGLENNSGGGTVTFNTNNVTPGNTYTITMTYQDGNNCSNSTSIDITVDELPTLEIIDQASASNLTTTDEFCFDDDIRVFEAYSNGSFVATPGNVSWSINTGGLVSNGDGTANFNPEVAALAVGETRTGDETDHIVTMSYTDGNGCASSVSYTITVNPQPDLNITDQSTGFDFDGAVLCYDQGTLTIEGESDNIPSISRAFSINTPNGSGGFQDNGNGTASINTGVLAADNGQDTLDTAENYIVTFDYTDDNGCANSITNTFTIAPLPDINFSGRDNVTYSENDDVYEVCYGDENIELIGIVSGETATRGQWTSNGPGIVSQSSGIAQFNPATARGGDQFGPAQTHTVTFIYSDANSCEEEITKTFIVHPLPELEQATDIAATPGDLITVQKACDGDSVTLNISLSNMAVNEISTSWYSATSLNALNPATAEAGGITFYDDISGDGNITQKAYGVLVQNDATGCINPEAERLVSVGDIPNPKFSWQGIIDGTQTTFALEDANLASNQISSATFEISDGGSSILSLTNQSLVPSSTPFTFPGEGAYDVSLSVVSNSACEAVITRTVNIIPLLTVPETGLTQNFDGSQNSWFTNSVASDDPREDTDVTQWAVGAPGGVFGNSSQGGNAWVTVPGGVVPDAQVDGPRGYFVYSPAYNLTALERPALSFLHNRDNPDNKDGAVMQYSLDDGITWTNVGGISETGVESGLKWYTNELINGLSKAGVDNPDFVGWSGPGEGWVESVHQIDNSFASVRFRFMYGSNGDGDAGHGFAFDNFRIFERDKITVIETFSSLFDANSQLFNETTNEIIEENGSGVLWLNYFGQFDNRENRVDPLSSRDKTSASTLSTYYGINDAPYTVLNGARQAEPTFGSGASDAEITGWTLSDLQLDGLKPPSFSIDFTDVSTSQDEVTLNVTVVSDVTLTNVQEIATRIFIVENEILASNLDGVNNNVHNVVRKMLPSPDGFNFEGTLTEGQTIGTYEVSWSINNVFDPDSLTAIVYVQNQVTKEIYQGGSIGLGDKENVITAIERQFLSGEDFAIFPNPANESLSVVFQSPVTDNVRYELMDQTGKVLIHGLVHPGEESIELDTEDLPQGVYLINVFQNDYSMLPRKVVITHR